MSCAKAWERYLPGVQVMRGEDGLEPYILRERRRLLAFDAAWEKVIEIGDGWVEDGVPQALLEAVTFAKMYPALQVLFQGKDLVTVAHITMEIELERVN